MDGNNASKDKEVELTERGFLYLAYFIICREVSI